MTSANEDELRRSAAVQDANAMLLARQRAELRAIFNQAAVGIALADLDGRFVDVNRKFAEILGFSAEELQARTFAEVTHPDDLAVTLDSVRSWLPAPSPSTRSRSATCAATAS